MADARFNVQHVQINSGSQVSGDIALKGARVAGIWAPDLTSCQLFLQGNHDTTSAGFHRLWNTGGGSEFAWDIGVGSAALALTDQMMPFPHARLESSVTQADTRSFAVITRP